MTIAACPRCHDEVTIPNGASGNAEVRCPLCQETYLLSEALDSMPPALIVIDDPDAGVAAASTPAFAAAGAASAEASAPAANDMFAFAGADAPGPAVAAPRPSSKSVSPTRRRKKQKNPVVEVVKVALGGIIGLSVGQLILWHMPFFDLQVGQRDPVKLGRSLGDSMPALAAWIVPPEILNYGKKSNGGNKQAEIGGDIRDLSKAFPTDKPGKQQPRRQQPRRQPAAAADPLAEAVDQADDNGLGFEVAEGLEELADLGDPVEPGLDTVPLDPADAPDSNNLGDLTFLPADPADPPVTNITDLPSDEPTDPQPSVPSAATPKPAALPRVPVKNARQIPASEVKTASAAASAALRAFQGTSNADASTRKDSLLMFRDRTSELAEAITLVDPADVADAELSAIQQLLEGCNNADMVKYIRAVGVQWLSHDSRHTPGVLVYGKVTEISPAGKFFATRINLENRAGDEITVLSAEDPTDTAYSVDAAVLFLGVIVENPAQSIDSYDGNDLKVIVSGLPYALGKSK